MPQYTEAGYYLRPVSLNIIKTACWPHLGDARKRYQVELTEPEINAIGALTGFLFGLCQQAGLTGYLNHYEPTLHLLSAKLQQFDDNNAPLDPRDAT